MGKSVVARLLAQWCVDRSAPFAAIDADSSHGSLLRSYGQFTQAVDLEAFASADEIVNRALGAERTVVVDLPAQSGRAMERWIESADVVRFAREAGIRLTLWHVSDGTFDSVRDLERTLESLGRRVPVHRGEKPRARPRTSASSTRATAADASSKLGGRVIDLPELDSAAMARIDCTGASFWSAIHDPAGAHVLAPLQRERARIWLGRCYKAFESVAARLKHGSMRALRARPWSSTRSTRSAARSTDDTDATPKSEVAVRPVLKKSPLRGPRTPQRVSQDADAERVLVAA